MEDGAGASFPQVRYGMWWQKVPGETPSSFAIEVTERPGSGRSSRAARIGTAVIEDAYGRASP